MDDGDDGAVFGSFAVVVVVVASTMNDTDDCHRKIVQCFFPDPSIFRALFHAHNSLMDTTAVGYSSAQKTSEGHLAMAVDFVFAGGSSGVK